MIGLKDEPDFCDEIDIIFSMGCAQKQSDFFIL